MSWLSFGGKVISYSSIGLSSKIWVKNPLKKKKYKIWKTKKQTQQFRWQKLFLQYLIHVLPKIDEKYHENHDFRLNQKKFRKRSLRKVASAKNFWRSIMGEIKCFSSLLNKLSNDIKFLNLKFYIVNLVRMPLSAYKYFIHICTYVRNMY